MKSVNELLADEAIRHQVDLSRYSNSVVRKIMTLLNRSDDRLFAELTSALERLSPASFTVERLEAVLGGVRSINAQAYELAGVELRKELQELTAYEAAYQRMALVSVLPLQVSVAGVAADVVYAAALARPFQGVILKGALADLEMGKAKLIRQTIAQGFTESKTTDQIVRELRGTRVNGYADGFFEGKRRDIEAVTRTALGHMAGFAQDRVVEANLDLIKAVVWSSTIDLKTSKDICIPRDGKMYTPDTHKPIGHSLPWLQGPGRAHWCCRSAQTYVIKSHKELGIDLPEVVLPNGTRASLDGQIPAKTDFLQWANKQSAERQDEIFGVKRGQLLRKGGLQAKDLYSAKGQFYTLEELKTKDAKAFEKAGL